jgi:hypothetical protein
MSDPTYQPKVYKKSGGDVMVVANGGQILVEPGGSVMSGNPTGAADYFVDGNVSATGSGSIADPFSTLAEAITASNTSIALTANRWWARRNRIFVIGDDLDEDLTTLPQKCDVIGLGCDDTIPGPRVLGHHSFAIGAGLGMGCRFINMGWICDQAGALFTFPAGAKGLQFLGGIMYPKVGNSTLALSLTDLSDIVIDGLEIAYNIGGGIFAEGISILGTVSHKNKIRNCDIYATKGIQVAAGNATTGGLIDRNNIYATALTINDESSLFRVTNNTLITAADANTITAAIVCNADLACGNIVSHSGTDLSEFFPLLKTT